MDEAPIEMPTSRWERLRADKRLMALVGASMVVVLVLLALLAGQLGVTDGQDSRRRVPVGVLDPTATMPLAWQPGEDSSAGGDSGSDSPVADPGDAPGADGPSVQPGEDPGEGGSAPDADPVVERAALIAYRVNGVVWVAGEDGTGARSFAEARSGAYALAPDGTILAVVDEGELALIGVEDGSHVVVGPAEPRALVWHPDSSALVFLRAVDGSFGVTEVFSVARTGGEVTRIMRADRPAVALDGTVVALPMSDPDPGLLSPAGELLVAPPGRRPRRVATTGPVAVCDIRSRRIVYAVSGVACIDASGEVLCEPDIRSVALDGTGDRRVVAPPSSARPFGYGDLIVSPDGKRLLYAEVGDDGYSRTWVGTLGGGAPTPLTIRRDTYPVGWSADGASIFFIEGNEFQGEATSLVTARTDGTRRRVLVEGATR